MGFEKVIRGVNLCDRNSRALVRDAKALMKRGSHGHALALAILALEEHGKKLALLSYASGRLTQKERSDVVRAFKTHTDKLSMSLLTYAEALEMPDRERKQTGRLVLQLDGTKLRGFYVDYFDDSWHSPFDVDIRRAAERLVPTIERTLRVNNEWAQDLVDDLAKHESQRERSGSAPKMI